MVGWGQVYITGAGRGSWRLGRPDRIFQEEGGRRAADPRWYRGGSVGPDWQGLAGGPGGAGGTGKTGKNWPEGPEGQKRLADAPHRLPLPPSPLPLTLANAKIGVQNGGHGTRSDPDGAAVDRPLLVAGSRADVEVSRARRDEGIRQAPRGFTPVPGWAGGSC